MTDRQLSKAKWAVLMAGLCAVAQLGAYYAAAEDYEYIDEAGELQAVTSRTELPKQYQYTDEAGASFPYASQEVFQFPRGRIVAYGGTAGVCTS